MTQPWNGPDHGPPARTGRPGRHTVLTALLSGLALIVAIGIIASTTGHAGRQAGGTTSAPGIAAASRGASWLSGPAGKLLRTVTADVGRLAVAERAARRRAAENAGRQLAADAKAALTGHMPPVGGKVYRTALLGLERAGTHASRGEFRRANFLVNAGDSDITKATATMNAAVSSPITVKEPNGR
jgi:hypothetical protein